MTVAKSLQYRALWSILRQDRIKIAISVLLSLIQTASIVPIALLLRRIFDYSLPNRDFAELSLLGLLSIALTIVAAVFGVASRTLALRATKDRVATLRKESINSLLIWPRSRITSKQAGLVHDSLVQDSERADLMINAILASILPSSLICLGLVVVLIYLSPLLSSILLLILPVGLLMLKIFNGSVKNKVQDYHHSFANFSSETLRLIRSWDLIKIIAIEESQKIKHYNNIQTTRDASFELARMLNLHGQIQQIFYTSAGIMFLIVGGYFMVSDLISVGTLLAFYAALGLLRNNLLSLLANCHQVITGLDGLERLANTLTADSEPIYCGNLEVSRIKSIEFIDTYFNYGSKNILKGISFSLNGLETLGICGTNGSGKTTILNLLLGFYKPTHGQLRVNSISYDDIDIASLRRQIGYLPQDPILSSGSILENIWLEPGEPDPDILKVALRVSGCSSFIEELPAKIKSIIGDEGLLLSGGQRQRLAIARALVRNPSLIIMDEPTAYLDMTSMRTLISKIKKEFPDTTLLIVSHDELLLNQCDRIIEICQGKVTERSTVSNFAKLSDFTS